MNMSMLLAIWIEWTYLTWPVIVTIFNNLKICENQDRDETLKPTVRNIPTVTGANWRAIV